MRQMEHSSILLHLTPFLTTLPDGLSTQILDFFARPDWIEPLAHPAFGDALAVLQLNVASCALSVERSSSVKCSCCFEDRQLPYRRSFLLLSQSCWPSLPSQVRAERSG